MSAIQTVINRYKQMRSKRFLENIYEQQYALVGIGKHSLNNLLPVIQHLQLPLKYICCTSAEKAKTIQRKYIGIRGTNSLSEILTDKNVKGVFVSTTPRTHFSIASEVLKSGKSLFIEKPPCESSQQLNALTDKIKLYGAEHVVVGLQRRFSPCTYILQNRLRKDTVHSYHYRYLTGLYPEGDALLDLFIHPIDYVIFLFGAAQIKAVETIKSFHNGGITLFLILQHRHLSGTLELSTDYSWQTAQDLFDINTSKGIYSLNRMEVVDFTPKHSSVAGIPLEKVFKNNTSTINLYGRNGFIPTMENNQIYSQGFYSEIETFANIVEHKIKDAHISDFDSLKNTYRLMDEIREQIQKVT